MKKRLIYSSILLVILYLSYSGRGIAQVELTPLEEVISETYPDAHGVIVFDSTKVVVDTTGERSYTQHKLIKILTQYGKEKFAEATTIYSTAYETTQVIVARVIKPDGITIDVQRQYIKDLPLFSPKVRMKKIIFPEVDTGSSIEWKVKRLFKEPPMEKNFSDVVVFEATEPIISKFYTLHMPVEMHLYFQVKGGVLGFNERTIGAEKIYSWEARNVPMIVPEPAMPPLPDMATKLLITTFTSWDTLAKWYYELARSSFEPDDAIAAKAAELTNNAKDDKDKIALIYEFVNQNIRCVDPKLKGIRKIHKPASASVTYANRYGNRADIAALLVSLLKSAGVNAYIALTSASIIVEQDIPAYQFDRTIVAIKDEYGRYMYLDPSAKEPLRFLDPHEQNKKVLICDENDGKLEVIPISSVEDNIFAFEATPLKFSKYMALTGTLFLELKGTFYWLLKEKRNQSVLQGEQILLQQIVGSLSKLADSTDILISRADDLDTSIVVKINYKAIKHGVETEDRIYFHPPGLIMLCAASCGQIGTPLGLSDGSHRDLSVKGLPRKREYPISMISTASIRGSEVIKIPDKYTVKELPDSLTVRHEDFSYHICYRYRERESEIESEMALILRTPLISINEYPDFKNMMEEVALTGKQVIILNKK